MKKILRYTYRFLAFVLMFSFLACANVVSPSGGPKDTVPPIVLKTSPENQSTNFSTKEIHITFDEFVTLNNPNGNILISPPLDHSPEYKLNGKSLIIKFKEPLKSETTYSFNFGEAIKDLHEGNIFKDYSFVFSTGDDIDTLILEGKLLQAADHKPSADFFVMLYSDNNDTISFDSLPYFVKPNYITKSNKDGVFKFSGVKDDNYLIFALKDGNSNYRFDLPNEDIAFLDSLVRPYYIPTKSIHDSTATSLDSICHDSITYNITDSLTNIIIDTIIHIDSTILTDSISIDSIIANDSIILNDSILTDTLKIDNIERPELILYTFLEEDSIQRLLKKEMVEEGLLRFVFSYPAQKVKIEVLDILPDTFAIYPTYSANYDSILWYYTPNKDSLNIAINYDTLINDTLKFSLKKAKSFRLRKEEQKVSRLKIATNVSAGKLKPEEDLILSFKEPITNITMRDTSWYIVNNDTIINDLQFEKIDSFGLKYKLDKTLSPEQTYKIIFPDSVFYSFKGITNDTTDISFKVPAVTEYGNIYINIEVPANIPQVIIQLTDEKDKILETKIIKETTKVAFTYLTPKKYKLRAILDSDGNGKWSPGHYGRKVLPESVIYHKDVFDVKANWDFDLEETWSF